MFIIVITSAKIKCTLATQIKAEKANTVIKYFKLLEYANLLETKMHTCTNFITSEQTLNTLE